MAFFGFEKRLQLLLIMGALAAAPGCYESISGSSDVTGDDPVADQRQDDPPADRVDVDALHDPITPDIYDEDFVVDPVPWPMCTEVETSSLTVFQTAARASTYADGSITLNLPYYQLTCNAPFPCISAVVNGSGTITQLDQTSQTQAAFRYENDSMYYGETVPIDFTWRVTCMGSSGMQMEEAVTATAYVCRDEMSGTLKIVNTSDECIPVVDPPPPPRAMSGGGPRIAGKAAGGGKVMLTLSGEIQKAERVVWEASAGSLQVLSPGKVLFTPARDRKIQVVQASIVTPGGVIIELYRHKI